MKIEEIKQMNIDDNQKVAIHLVPIPEFKEKDFYRIGVSFDAFFHSTRERNKSDKYFFYHRYTEDWEKDDLLYKMIEESENNLPRIEHKSLWDFYDYIGYDRKRKKYLKGDNNDR